jgi:hypothetical protein
LYSTWESFTTDRQSLLLPPFSRQLGFLGGPPGMFQSQPTSAMAKYCIVSC